VSTAEGRTTAWAWWIGTFFGVGRLKPGPGTYGSAAAALVWWVGAHAWQPGRTTWAVCTLFVALAVTFVGIPAATIVAREAGREDPGFVVIDEVAGQLIALILLRPDWKHAALGLVLFRVFDIWKPWPVRRLEELPDGTGIMLDDAAAGLLALMVGVIVSHWF